MEDRGEREPDVAAEPMSADATHTCAQCGKQGENLKRCSACKSVHSLACWLQCRWGVALMRDFASFAWMRG